MYKQAMEMVRRHRVDPNIIYDHSPVTFMSHVAAFVRDVGDVDRLSLFISALNSGDCTQIAYPPPPAPAWSTAQINQVRTDLHSPCVYL